MLHITDGYDDTPDVPVCISSYPGTSLDNPSVISGGGYVVWCIRHRPIPCVACEVQILNHPLYVTARTGTPQTLENGRYNMNAFITGSRAYGNARPDSDIDLVIRVDEQTARTLRELADPDSLVNDLANSVRFGRINLLLCTTDDEWHVWRNGTTDLINRANINGPVGRMEAIFLFQSLRHQMGISFYYSKTDDEEEGLVEESS